MNHQRSELRAIMLEILAGREETQFEPNCVGHLYAGIAEVLQRREPPVENLQSIAMALVTLSDADKLLAQEIFWDLLIERVVTPGCDLANSDLLFFRLHSEASRLHTS